MKKSYYVVWNENNEVVTKKYASLKTANKKACELLMSDNYTSDMNIKVMTYENNTVTNIEDWR